MTQIQKHLRRRQTPSVLVWIKHIAVLIYLKSILVASSLDLGKAIRDSTIVLATFDVHKTQSRVI